MPLEFGKHVRCPDCKGTGNAHILRNGKRVMYSEQDPKTKKWLHFGCPECFGLGIVQHHK